MPVLSLCRKPETPRPSEPEKPVQIPGFTQNTQKGYEPIYPQDADFFAIAEDAILGNTTLPSGVKTPEGPFIIISGAMYPKR